MSHGESGFRKTTEYKAWLSLFRRVRYQAHYKGVEICERWDKYENFLEDMGRKPTPKHSLDRIDNSKGYFKENCRWATAKEQARNRTSNNNVTINGETKCVAAWLEDLGISDAAFHKRIHKYGMTPEEALTTPKMGSWGIGPTGRRRMIYQRDFVLTYGDIPRVEICPASAVYTQKKEGPSGGQWWGIAIHLFLRKFHEDGRESAIAHVERKFPRMKLGPHVRSINTSLLPEAHSVEGDMLINTIDGYALEGNYREAVASEHYLTRFDVLAKKDGLDHVIDYKSGKPQNSDDSAETSIQLRLIAAGRWLMKKQKGIWASIVFPSTDKTKAEESVAPTYRTAFYPDVELQAFIKRARRAHLLALEARAELREEGNAPEFVEGGHCRGCDLEKHCHGAIGYVPP